MKYTLLTAIVLFPFLSCVQKGEQNTEQVLLDKEENVFSVSDDENDNSSKTELQLPVKVSSKENLIPKGFVLFDEIVGDLDKDGQDDYVLIIKGTDRDNIIEDEYRGQLDRNRRGIIIALGRGDHYEKLVDNRTCFSSENEDGGVYFAPEMNVSIQRGLLNIDYAHGRYGYWGYLFRYQNNTFELIGFESHSNRGPVAQGITSINFSTGRKCVSVNLNADLENADELPEKWQETWSNIDNVISIDMNSISDFDDLHF